MSTPNPTTVGELVGRLADQFILQLYGEYNAIAAAQLKRQWRSSVNSLAKPETVRAEMERSLIGADSITRALHRWAYNAQPDLVEEDKRRETYRFTDEPIAAIQQRIRDQPQVLWYAFRESKGREVIWLPSTDAAAYPQAAIFEITLPAGITPRQVHPHDRPANWPA